ncbi:MAG TPA: MmcQ/YjbR family DNA-binding protein [Chthonomonadaceae bacterium]|nr:MmcQ/YjbR family DNA-binding protein [Chthonomonadaceae bacterium]
MSRKPQDEDPITRIRALCLALPEAVEQPFGGHTAPSFRVRGKFFVMLSEDRTQMTCKAPPGTQQALVGSAPDRFFVPAYVGHKGWVGIRLDVEQDWEEIRELIDDSYCMTAPKRHTAQLSRPEHGS